MRSPSSAGDFLAGKNLPWSQATPTKPRVRDVTDRARRYGTILGSPLGEKNRGQYMALLNKRKHHLSHAQVADLTGRRPDFASTVARGECYSDCADFFAALEALPDVHREVVVHQRHRLFNFPYLRPRTAPEVLYHLVRVNRRGKSVRLHRGGDGAVKVSWVELLTEWECCSEEKQPGKFSWPPFRPKQDWAPVTERMNGTMDDTHVGEAKP